MRRMWRQAAALGFLAILLAAGAAVDASAGKQLRVGLVIDSTDVSDSFQHSALLGLQRAVHQLHVSGKIVVPSRAGSYLPSFAYLARKRYDLIIALGFFEVADLDIAARDFPRSTFALVDGSRNDLPHRPPNVGGTDFKTEQAGYLAGYLAALLEKRRPGPDVLGSVGGVKIPAVDDFIAGYQAGARAADPRITLLNAYSQDFDNASKCRAIAEQQIAAGAGAIFQVADACGLGALAAARDKHVWGIGVDVDQSYLGPHVLSSVVKHVDVAIFDTVKAFKAGKLRPGSDAVYDLENNGVGLGKFSPKVPRSMIAALEPIRQQIVAGTIKVPAKLSPR